MSDYATIDITAPRIYIQSTPRGHDALIDLGGDSPIRLEDVQVYIDGQRLTGDPMAESETWRR